MGHGYFTMAECCDLPSIQHSSDADIEACCTLCDDDGTREDAVKFCSECQEYMCTACIKHHRRMKTTKSHSLLDMGEVTHDTTSVRVVMSAKCLYHPERDIEMYCGAHNMVYCSLCIATKHRSCDGITNIDDVPMSDCDENVIQQVQTDLKSIHEQLSAANEKKENNIACIDEQRRNILTKIREAKRKITEHLDNLGQKVENILITKCSDIKDQLQLEIKKVTGLIEDISNRSNQLEAVVSMDETQRFVQTKLGQKVVMDAKKLYEVIESKNPQAVMFTKNDLLCTPIMTTTSLGSIEMISENKQSKPKPIKIKSKKVVNIRVLQERCVCDITGICQLLDGTIVLADYWNRKLKMLDKTYNVKDHCDLEAAPYGVCCTGPSEVAVKLVDNKIQFISVGTSLSKLKTITIIGGNIFGIAHFAGELLVSTGNEINVYNTSGTLLKSIGNRQRCKQIFEGEIRQIAVVNQSIIVTHGCDGAVCLGKNWAFQRNFRDIKLKGTFGVCVSRDGTVFLSGFTSNNIVMFSEDGKCLGELVMIETDLKGPQCMCYDDRNNSIILGCCVTDLIHVIELDN